MWWSECEYIYKEMNERKDYEIEFTEELGGKQFFRADDFSYDVIDMNIC